MVRLSEPSARVSRISLEALTDTRARCNMHDATALCRRDARRCLLVCCFPKQTSLHKVFECTCSTRCKVHGAERTLSLRHSFMRALTRASEQIGWAAPARPRLRGSISVCVHASGAAPSEGGECARSLRVAQSRAGRQRQAQRHLSNAPLATSSEKQDLWARTHARASVLQQEPMCASEPSRWVLAWTLTSHVERLWRTCLAAATAAG